MSSVARAALALVIAALLTGALTPIGKYALSYVDSYGLLMTRFLIASVIAFPFWFASALKHDIPWQRLGVLALTSVAGAAAMLLYYEGLMLSDALAANFLGSTAGVVMTIMGIVFLHEHETQREWLGLGIALAGTLMIIVLPHLADGSLQATHGYDGIWYIMAAVVLGSINAILIKRFSADLPKVMISGVAALVILLVLSASALLSQRSFDLTTMLSAPVMYSALYQALFGSLLGVSLEYYGYQYIEASEATLFSYLKPLAYVPLSVWWLGEKVMLMQLLGLAVVVIGVYIAEKRSPVGLHAHYEHH